MRRFSETVAVATAELAEPGPGLYLVEGTAGPELLEIQAVGDGLCLSKDGRGFPLERAHYVFAIVQLVDPPSQSDQSTGPDTPTGKEGDADGNATDQD